MPLVAFALLAYLLALLAAFGDQFALVVAAAIVGALAAFLLRRAAIGVIALAGLAGALAANAAKRDDEWCRAGIARSTSFTLELDDAVRPGAFARGRVACHAVVSLAVSRGQAPAGATVVAGGNVVLTRQGVLLQRASVRVQCPPGALARLRTSAGLAIDHAFGTDAPLARALLIADTRDLSPELKERFAVSGMAHILSISGLHVGIIALAIELVLQLAGVARRSASIATLIVVALYVAMIGCPAPAMRSAVMLGVATASRELQRPTSPWAILAIGGAQPLFEPRVVLDLGFQLSVVGVAALIAAGHFVRRLRLRQAPSALRGAAAGVIGTLIATIASAPLVAWTFGRVSLIAPISNLLAGPVIAVLQPMLFLAMVLGPAPTASEFVGDAAHPLLVALDGIASRSASIPGAALSVSPSPFAAMLAGLGAVAVLVACASRHARIAALVALTSAAALVWLPLVPPETTLVELHLLDVGQGDAIALRTPHGEWIVVDAGRAWRGGDAGRSMVVPYIARRGGTTELFVLSHPHTDHVGGGESVIRRLHPRRYLDAGFAGGADAYRASLLAAKEDGVLWTRAKPGERIAIDGVELEVLAPDSVWTASLDDPNLASVVIRVSVGAIHMLLMGDAERPEEDWLLAHAPGDLQADVLKVGHHGSTTSTSPAFLARVKPRLALVSVGAGNSYGLPDEPVLRALAAAGAQVLRTDRLGTIVARTDGHRLFVEAGGDSWELSPASMQ